MVADNLPESLTKREREILAYLAEGLSNREIAEQLYLSVGTIKVHTRNIYGKLGVSGRTQAVTQANKIGLLDLDSKPSEAISEGKHNLLEQTTQFVGRQQEISEIVDRLSEVETRLITILAPGGMGKTRLSQEVARTQIGHYLDGVFFVPLAPISDADDIVTTVADTIGFAFHGEDSPSQQLVRFLRDRSMLLVMDNFEHLLEGATLILDIVQSAPKIKILVTSREKLNVRGELVFTLRGLEFPTWETPEDALEYDAVKLFMQSAHRISTEFELRAEDLDYLARICRLTAGMPLAIELAAGWVDVLSMEQIASEVQSGIDILETEMRDMPERHRSIRVTFERTWTRLDSADRDVFMKLSVFRGGFTLSAAEAVAGANVRSMRRLMQKSLIQSDSNDRYTTHELLRQFGAGKLEETDASESVRSNHAFYFAEFMEARKSDFKGSRQVEGMALVDSEFENVRLAWIYIVNHQHWDQFPMFLTSLWFYCDIRSRSQDVLSLFEFAIVTLKSEEAISEVELALGRILAWTGWFYNDLGFYDKARDVCQMAISMLEPLDGLEEDLFMAFHSLTMFEAWVKDMVAAQNMCEESLRLARVMTDRYWEARGIVFKAVVLHHTDSIAYDLAEEAYAIFENLGSSLELWLVLRIQSVILLQNGNFQRAKEKLIRSEQFNLLLQSAYHSADTKRLLGIISIEQGDYSEAKRYLFESLYGFWDAGYSHFASGPLLQFAQLLARKNVHKKAVEILAFLNRYPTMYYDTIGIDPIYDILVSELETRMEPGEFVAAWERGQEREINTLIIELLEEFENAD